eukprot:TRINITY_DN1920_c0_g1_i1.p1 TRINITY_DN1920_c0_g1~~TRINITY_DN1920_c0_g1_i1.p1  ORF type:complete len:351 (-),score=94.81 TRINITY_DN1920_c0_g1_i1:68-1120(-)
MPVIEIRPKGDVVALQGNHQFRSIFSPRNVFVAALFLVFSIIAFILARPDVMSNLVISSPVMQEGHTKFSMEYLQENHLLAKFKEADLRIEPFPYVVIKDALPQDLYKELARTFPSMRTIVELSLFRNDRKDLFSNQRLSAAAKYILESDSVPEIWKDFVQVHLSQEFTDATLKVFGGALDKYHPWFHEKFPNNAGLTPATRFTTHNEKYLVDCQIAINTPVTAESTSVIPAHLDEPRELFAGLFYMRDEDDESTGGALETFEKTGNRLPDGNPEVKVFETVPYEANLLVLFMGTRHSIHAVTPRSKTPFMRKFVNLVSLVEDSLFSYKEYNQEPIDKKGYYDLKLDELK